MPIDFEEYESQKRRSLRVPISSTAAYFLIQLEVGTGVFKFVILSLRIQLFDLVVMEARFPNV